MAMGTRVGEYQETMWVATNTMPTPPGHHFCERLNPLLSLHGFDDFAVSRHPTIRDT